MAPSKIICLHASAGHGHRKAAEAVAEAVGARYPEARVEVLDALDFFPKWVKKAYADGYVWMISECPALWGLCYRASEIPWMRAAIRPLRRFFHATLGRKLEKYLIDTQPIAVISTHFMPTEVCGFLRSRNRDFKALTVVTDYLVHPFWLHSGVDAYAAAAEETREALIRLGIPAPRIQVTGIPVGKNFEKAEDTVAARRKLGLQPDLHTLLFTSGGSGAGTPLETIERMLANRPGWQAVLVCGSSEGLKAKAQEAAGRIGRLCVQGFVRNMHEWMDAADVVIGKAGGITVTETLAKKKKFVVIKPVPGQEEWNAEVLSRAGALVRVNRPEDLEAAVARLFEDPETSRQLTQGIERVSKPHSSRDIALWIGQMLEWEPKKEGR